MLKFYSDLVSAPCRALALFMNYSKIAHVNVPIALRKGEVSSNTKLSKMSKPC